MQTQEPNTPTPRESDALAQQSQVQGEPQREPQRANYMAAGSDDEPTVHPDPERTVEGALYAARPGYPSYPAYPPQNGASGSPTAATATTTPSRPPYELYNTPSAGSWPGYPPPQPGPSRRRSSGRRWLFALGAVVVLMLLLVGLAAALGHAITTQPTGSSSSTVGGSAPTAAVPPSAQDLQQTIINVIQTTQPSVVEVTSRGPGGGGIGSGVVLRPDGYIVTNDHVVAGFSSFAVTLSNGKQEPATLKGEDPQDDLAVLHVNETHLRPINFADSAKVRIGQFAIAIGNPLGLTQSSTFGIISALNRTASEGQQGPASLLTGLIQTSAPINPGNSGGALVDLQGQLIGIPTLGVVDQQTGGAAAGIGFAIPSDRVKFVAQQLIQNGHLTSTGQGFLGVRGEDVTPDLASADNLPVQAGVLITGFVNDAAGKSPAQGAGLRAGDIITSVNGQAVGSNADLASALISQSPGTGVSITVARGSGTQTVTVTLGERPTNLQG